VKQRRSKTYALRRRESPQQTRTVTKVGADFYILASSLTSRRSHASHLINLLAMIDIERF
jgi:hypothetical protein